MRIGEEGIIAQDAPPVGVAEESQRARIARLVDAARGAV
jgi:hypothetical protein